jgi:hypothetical protein
MACDFFIGFLVGSVAEALGQILGKCLRNGAKDTLFFGLRYTDQGA